MHMCVCRLRSTGASRYVGAEEVVQVWEDVHTHKDITFHVTVTGGGGRVPEQDAYVCQRGREGGRER